MKNYPLSTFQKEQYTQYLETQLEKFSAFMLSQKKQNQKYHLLQAVIDKQNTEILRLSDRMKILELYQKDNFKHSQRVENSNIKTNELDHRLKKVQSMYFEREVELSSHRYQDDLQLLKDDLMRKIKVIEKDMKKITQEKSKPKGTENSPLQTNYSDVQSVRTNQNFVSKFELKKMEEKLNGFFEKNFNRIQRMIRKSINRSQKKDLQRRNQEEIFVQQQTFGQQPSNYNDYEMDSQLKTKEDKSISLSDASGRLYPVQYYSQKEVDKQNKKRLERKRISRSRSMPKDKSRSVKSKTGSRSVSRSKSMKKNERKKRVTKTPQRQEKSNDKLSCVKQYKKLCKKKHF